MVNKLDPQLWYLIRKYEKGDFELASSELVEWVGLSREEGQQNIVEVLVRCIDANRTEALRNVGMDIHFSIPQPLTIASGKVTLDVLEKLEKLDFIARVEASHPMLIELDISLQASCAASLHQNHPSVKGEGVIIGLIDTGIDFKHESFRNSDGTSRVLYLWDQGAEPLEQNGNISYGREYTKVELDQALMASQTDLSSFAQVSHQDVNGHGTHVAGIAAGNGRASQDSCIGLAPDADLIVVAFEIENFSLDNSDEPMTVGRSVRIFDALNYIVQRAKEEGKPVAINLSFGTNIGGHAGETIIEQSLDGALLRLPNVIMVKSAGNEQDRLGHTGGNITQGETKIVEFEVCQNSPYDFLEVWYDGIDNISLALQPPDSSPLEFVSSDEIYEDFLTQNYNNHIDLKYSCNVIPCGDTSATFFLKKGEAEYIQPGVWTLHLRGDAVQVGRYDVWINGGILAQREKNKFLPNYADDSCRITIPGNAKRIVTVGSYVTRSLVSESLQVGNISLFSSRGPTRYGLLKPEIAAPGEWIVSARSQESRFNRRAYRDRQHTLMRGTSMAAPHVTGAAALILSVCPHDLTCEQVKQILMRTARQDEFTYTPENAWGRGKLNVEQAVEYARTVRFPQISNVKVEGITLSWDTDIPTRTVVRYHSHPGKLQLGKTLGEQKGTKLHTNHTLTLSGLSSGTYYCEIVALSADDWWTVDDNSGEFYVVEIAD